MARPVLFRLTASTALALVLASGPLHIDTYHGAFGVPAAHADTCCFTGETPVMMADATQRPISEIRPGDRVMSSRGRANRVVRVHEVRLGARRLWGVNDMAPFFTAEHPFLTPAGWKALDPAAARREVPGLAIGRMRVGDVLLAARPGAGCDGALALDLALAFDFVPIRRIDSIAAPAELPVYNLLLDGDHSYIADGFAVHNKDGDGGGGDGDGGDGDGDGGDGDGDGGEGDGGGGEGDGGDGGEGDSGSDDGSDDGGDGSGQEGSGEDDGGESGSGGSGSGVSGGEAGEAGSGSGSESGEGGFSGSAEPSGEDLSQEQERGAIASGWQ